MADNVAVTAGTGTSIAADEVVDGTLGTVKVQYVKLMDGTLDGSTKAAVGSNGLKVDPTSAVAMNTGTRSATTQRVTIATDDNVPVTLTAETTKVIGTVRVASGGIASGSVASGAVASGAYAAGSLAAGAGVDGWDLTQGAIADAAVTAGATGSISAKLRSISRDIVSNIVLAAGSNLIGLFKLSDGTNTAAVKAASTAPVASDPALVVAISPNSVNANTSDGSGQTTSTHVGAPTIPYDAYSQYETVAASQTDQVMGATGAQYDYLAGVLVIPGTSAAGAVSIKDGNGSSISVFAGGGTTALADLKPFLVPLGLHALASTSAGWKITTGANVTAIGIGKFT